MRYPSSPRPPGALDRPSLLVTGSQAGHRLIKKKGAMIVMLTDEQRRALSLYLSLTAHIRRGEIENWSRLEDEKSEDGTPVWRNAAGNKAFWEELTAKIEEIAKMLDAIQSQERS